MGYVYLNVSVMGYIGIVRGEHKKKKEVKKLTHENKYQLGTPYNSQALCERQKAKNSV